MAVRARQGKVWTVLRSFDRPMGLAVKEPGQFVLGTRTQIWDFRDSAAIAAQLEPAGQYDACFMPRQCHVTGDILGHELAWGGTELWLVNTMFSCLCTLDPACSFVPRWRPPFITSLVPEDRCHLNGFTLADGVPEYVTALGQTDSEEGWRANKASGGILLHVPSGQVIADGLSMPHSPRWHGGRLWILEGGTGQLQTVEPATGRRESIVELPGFARGLAFHGPYAFVGLSQIRESARFGGLPIATRVSPLRCGIWVVDLRAGKVCHFMEFQSGVEEIFAIEVLCRARFPEILGLDELLDHVFVLPG